MHHLRNNSKTPLAIGAALLGCALAAADRAEAQNMLFTTLTQVTLSGTADAHTLPNTLWTGSANYLDGSETYSKMPIPSAYIISYLTAYSGGSYDSLFWDISSGFIQNWNLSGSFDVTFSQAVILDYYFGTWLIDSVALADGQLVAAGSYTLQWTMSDSASYRPNLLEIFGAGAPVPLPGAAGLAACGLLGLSRRRRR